MSNDPRIPLRGGVFWEDPRLPPEPLFRKSGSRGGVFRFREGGRIELRNRTAYSPQVLFMLTLSGSACLGGQPLRCSGFRPGVSLRVAVRQFPSADQQNPDMYTESVWRCVQPIFERWLADPMGAPGFDVEIEVGDIKAQFARDALLQLRPGVMQIDVLD